MNNFSLQRKEIEKIYGKISPFELKDKLIGLAEESKESGTHSLLDAGRGNPNWIAATPREAFFTFGQFAIEESRRVWSENDLAGMPKREGISERFIEFVKNHQDAPGIDLLSKMINYGVTVKGFKADNWIHELADGIIGDNYPQPDRMLRHIESVVNDYLIQELCYNEPLEGKFNVFAVEGATAGMCYIFDSLIANNILSKGDKIALMAPIFTPYLEIPHLPRYNFDVVKVLADETDENGNRIWQYSSSEMDKLKDPDIKALFIVNPSNPASIAMKHETINYLKHIVDNYNSDLMIISDDVYGTFVDDFRSIMADLPYNTIGVYSYSKYFGVTGWRLGTIALYEKNVFDKLLREQDEDRKERARRRYSGISTDPDSIPFIDRIVADSRQVALNHTAGLSTPQQVQMAFFSLFAIIDRENKYKQLTNSICRRRKKLLFDGLGLDLRKDPFDASYYTQFDLLEWASHNYDDEFADYLQNNYKPVDILLRLAEQSSIVLLSSSGFDGPEWSIRISLANLNDESYPKIGQVLRKILGDYVAEWNESQNS
ncbi:aspartate 4-decarboxylase [Clostridium thailandense]|uniref:Aspartate 4-decarboxylase n=1 Tax=Clostridium thailandense TaxID=2794346 RepID=A0A949WRY3_9CLOT|nr:aspartate 4-decarboxylase [Clostridium thailandense]MBV7274565.1 aspartate 4-decarboxylase [Clostridium thailandense]